MNLLHISALPIWSMDGKGGMPSLRETLNGHVREKHDIEVILPQYDLFSDDFAVVSIKQTDVYSIHMARCRWLPMVKAFRNRVSRVYGRNTIPYPIRSIINVSMLCLLTFSLVKASKKICIQNNMVPDLVYAHNQYAALAGYILGKIFKVPNVNKALWDLFSRFDEKAFCFSPVSDCSSRIPGAVQPADLRKRRNQGR